MTPTGEEEREPVHSHRELRPVLSFIEWGSYPHSAISGADAGCPHTVLGTVSMKDIPMQAVGWPVTLKLEVRCHFTCSFNNFIKKALTFHVLKNHSISYFSKNFFM